MTSRWAAILITLSLVACEEVGISDPRAYGAIPNDGVDDAPAIQQAIRNTGDTGGGVVILGKGEWTIGSAISLDDAYSVRVRGLGREITRLKRLNPALPIFRTTRQVANQSIEDMTLDGGRGEGDAPLVDIQGLWIASSIARVKFQNYRNGVRIVEYIVVRLYELEMQARDEGGISLQAGVQRTGPHTTADLTIVDTLIQGGSVGVGIFDADAVFMRNTDITFVGHIAMLILPTASSQNHTFSANFFDSAPAGCVVMGGPGLKAQIIFDANWVASCADGYQLQSAGAYQDISITGGRVFNISRIGLYVDGYQDSLLVQGVQFSQIGGPAMFFSPRARGSSLALSGNAFRAVGRDRVGP